MDINNIKNKVSKEINDHKFFYGYMLGVTLMTGVSMVVFGAYQRSLHDWWGFKIEPAAWENMKNGGGIIFDSKIGELLLLTTETIDKAGKSA